ncbi:hypothetical protein HPP92_013450 [Vanilla planifolia]|uniref:DNA polymerase III gamma subunit domain-containing protein n=1 Tax=Vanilla planifolia TaxID=51239 RepID=A0A835QUX7_VANPL|nr:hypothetical protein HPP92_013450 [Vanilla planifolia]
MSGGISSSTDLSEGNESSNSSKLISGNKKSNQKGTSGHASPVFSGSQCGNISFSSKIYAIFKREMSSGTPASHKSQNICENKKKSCHGSQDGTRFYNDWYGFKQINQQGCGVPCYWPKRKKGLSSRSSCSSLFDTPSKKFGAMLSRGQLHGKIFSTTLNKDFLAKSSQSSPLLISSFDDYDSSTEAESELSAYLYELDLEGRSRLDGKRWSIHRNQEDLSIPQTSSIETSENGSLSRKYRPRVFSDIVGQSLIVQSLENAILTGKIAPAYLFQGPRGTGKSSTAQVLAAALNCTSSGQNRPCGLCIECISFASGNGSNVTIVDSKNKKDVGILKLLLKNACCASMFSQCKVVIIENCHIFSTKSWFEFMKYLEQPLPCFVFIFISLDSKNLPRSVVSRCQKFLFGKIKDADISTRLCYICTEEMVDFDLEAINLISAHSDGSLKDAETMLHQLTVLNRKISNSLVYEIIGLVSEEKLIDLLLIALSSNTKKTMRRCRELLSCGVDPVAIMCQLTGLIVDIITGACQLSSLQTCNNTTAVQSCEFLYSFLFVFG